MPKGMVHARTDINLAITSDIDGSISRSTITFAQNTVHVVLALLGGPTCCVAVAFGK